MKRRGSIFLLGFMAVALCALPAAAAGSGQEGSGEPERHRSHLLESPWLLGNPGGYRQLLDLNGVTLQLFYTQFLSWKPTGGAVPYPTSGHNGGYDFFTRIDAEQLFGWPGLVGLLRVKGQYDRNINRDVGALSDPVDDADFDAGIWIDELWLQQSFFDDRLQVRGGLLEQQTIFDRNAFANSEDIQFSTSFLDNNPLVPLPNGLGATLLLRPFSWLEIATGFCDADNVPRNPGFDTLFDGVDSLTGYVELDFHVELPGPRGPLAGNYRIGGFIDGRSKLDFESDRFRRGHGGVYLSFDQLVFQERANASDGLGLFARFGWTDPDVNALEWFWSFGGRYLGLLPGRSHDVVGFGVYQAIASEAYRSTLERRIDKETGLELYYNLALRPWLAVTPDFQYIFDPGAIGVYDDAVVATIRFRVTF